MIIKTIDNGIKCHECGDVSGYDAKYHLIVYKHDDENHIFLCNDCFKTLCYLCGYIDVLEVK